MPDPFVEIGRADRQAISGHQRRHPHGRLAAVRQAVEGDPLRVDEGQARQPLDDLLVLRHDDREERFLDRIGLALQRAEAIAEEIKVLRGEGHEAAVGQPGRVIVIELAVAEEHVGGPALQAVLADDHRPPLARLDVLGHQQHAIREDVGKHVQDNLVAGPFLALVALSRPWPRRQRPVVEAANHFLGEVLAVRLDGLRECGG